MPSQPRLNQNSKDLFPWKFPYAHTPWGMLSLNTGFTGWFTILAPILTEDEGSIATFLGTQTFSLNELTALPLIAPIYLNEIQFFQELRNAIKLDIASETSAGVFSINGDLLVQKFNDGVYGTWRWDITGPFELDIGTKEELFRKDLKALEEMGVDLEQWGFGKQEALQFAELDIQDCLACGAAKIDCVVDGENIYILNLDIADVAIAAGLVGRWRWLADWNTPEQQEEAKETEEQKAADKMMISEIVNNTKLKISEESKKELIEDLWVARNRLLRSRKYNLYEDFSLRLNRLTQKGLDQEELERVIHKKWLLEKSKTEWEAFCRLSTEVRDHAKGNTRSDEINSHSDDGNAECSESDNKNSGV